MVVFGQVPAAFIALLMVVELVCHAASSDNNLSSVQDYILDSKLLGLSDTKLFDRVVSILLLF